MKSNNSRKVIKKKALSEPKGIFVRSLILILAVNSLISLFLIVLCDFFDYEQNIDIINYFLLCFNLILTMPLFINYKNLILMNARDEIIAFRDLFTNVRRMLSYTLFFSLIVILFVLIIYILSLLPFVGNILAILLFIYFFPVFIFLPFVFLDNRNDNKNDIFLKTIELLENRRVEFYGMLFSFVGWIFLGFLTAGVLFIWVVPYISIVFSYQYLSWKHESEYEQTNSLSNCGVILIYVVVFLLLLCVSFVNIPNSFSNFVNDLFNYNLIVKKGNSSLEYGGAEITFDKPEGYKLLSKTSSVKTFASEDGKIIQYSVYMSDVKDIIKIDEERKGESFNINVKGMKLDGYQFTSEDEFVVYYPKGAFVVTVYFSNFGSDFDKNKIGKFLNIY